MASRFDLPVPLDLAPMEAKLVDDLPTGPGWRFEPKWDGFRCLAFRSGDAVALRAKSGKPLDRYFPEMVAALLALPVAKFVVDGELTIAAANGPAFEALQMRLHPAESRVRKLAAETPSTLVMFDCLVDRKGASLLDAPLTQRLEELHAMFGRFSGAQPVRLSPGTENLDEAHGWLAQEGGALDGVIAKRLDDPYRPGKRAMLKIKRLRTADCVVGGFRYAQGTRVVGSLLLGLYDCDGRLNHVGFTSSFAEADRPELTLKVEALAGGCGFTGRAPGAPSRWSNERSTEWTPLRHELVAEVRYDHVTGDRFRHGTRFLRWRPDKAPEQCTLAQLRAENPPDHLIGDHPWP